MQNKDFFIEHTFNKIQDKMNLSDEEMASVRTFVENLFENDSAQAAKLFLKNKDVNSLSQMIKEVLGH